MIKRLVSFIKENKWKYRLQGNIVRVFRNSSFTVGNDCHFQKSNVFVDSGSLFELGNDVLISNCNIYIKGHVTIGSNTILRGGVYTIENGTVKIGHHCKLSAKRFWVRFGGVVNVGDYTNINDGSEVRCDESVNIGRYNQISYNVNIWDTNTHNIYPPEKRRNLTEKYWPYFGREIERPATKPVYIGDDCWIGENSAILKGTMLNKEVVVGYNTVIIGLSIDKGKKVVNAYNLRIL
jgi:acetyltransferase-like isoleucine patch superfamily enzyme